MASGHSSDRRSRSTRWPKRIVLSKSDGTSEKSWFESPDGRRRKSSTSSRRLTPSRWREPPRFVSPDYPYLALAEQLAAGPYLNAVHGRFRTIREAHRIPHAKAAGTRGEIEQARRSTNFAA